ncbi:hypothetical protein Csp1_04880 [Corynebacterium provencense]|jgi:trehalose 6-phosphate phosphatase|uniref:Mycothiol-dependent maleylpyruvate isomerase metal-binding domain-containing protein n=1 Tax=Corynebacterium provencense TaxID=1737425 RepID=A0A2Z3YTD5_9CORY|nr:TIGR03086 family metal-binding protein [Corynebacterium provencense]AWT25307.1 hypothetical protein Csp1_04880 [Corynebacterium provencense]MCI1255447.1 TIGR03086 family metal-binding protein [Corynebacterium provencense]
MALSTAPADRFREVAEGFTAQATGVTGEGWDAQTPCAKWKARDLVGHLISWFTPALEDVGVPVDLQEDKYSDPAAAWRQFAAIVQDALDDPEVAQRTVSRGPVPGQPLSRNATAFFIPDIFMHTWDLARSQGHDVELDPDFAERNLAGLRSLGDQLQAGGGFGPPVEAPEDATPTIRLMAYVGRDPAFGLDRQGSAGRS